MFATTKHIQATKDQTRTYGIRIYSRKRSAADQQEDHIFNDNTLRFRKEQIQEIKKYAITKDDVVLLTVPRTALYWMPLIETCIYSKSTFILPKSKMDAVSIAKAIGQEKVTTIVTTTGMWEDIQQELDQQQTNITRISAIVFNEDDDFQMRHHFIQPASSQSKTAEVFAAGNLLPAIKHQVWNN